MGIVNAGAMPIYTDIPEPMRQYVEEVVLNNSEVRAPHAPPCCPPPAPPARARAAQPPCSAPPARARTAHAALLTCTLPAIPQDGNHVERLLKFAEEEKDRKDAGGVSVKVANKLEWREKPIRERLTYSLIKGKAQSVLRARAGARDPRARSATHGVTVLP